LVIPSPAKAVFVGAKKVYTPDLSDNKVVKVVPARFMAAFNMLRLGSVLIASIIEDPVGAGGTMGSAWGKSLLQATSILAAAAIMNEDDNILDVFSFMIFFLIY
jgi:hypothetical protein